MTRRPGAGVLALWLACVGCRALPTIPSGECGNRVVESGEDCDYFPVQGRDCRAAGSLGACHLDCSPVESGMPGSCPADFGCDENHVCRRATDGFDVAPVEISGSYRSVRTADFDGDGRAEVVGLDLTAGSLGVTHIDVHYFDERGQPSSSVEITEALTDAATFDLGSGDGRQGIVAAGYALAVLQGERDRTLSPDVRPTFFMKDTRAVVLSVWDQAVQVTTPLVVLAERDGALELDIPNEAGPLLSKLVDLPFTVDELAPAATGQLFTSPEHGCKELVLAPLGERELSSYQVCERDAKTGWITYRAEALITRVRLPDGAVVAGGPLIADLDGDGHDDLLVISDRGLYAAYGDGEKLTPLSPFELGLLDRRDGEVLPLDQTGTPVRPIAAGDITGDGRADLVDPHGLLVSVSAPQAPGNIFRVAHPNDESPWTEAKIGDLNGDGLRDLVAASSATNDFDVFFGNGTDRPNPLTVTTKLPVEKLAIGDFDADRSDDVAFVTRGSGPSGDDELFVAFGGSIPSLSKPVHAGHVHDVLGMISLNDDDDDLRSDLAVTHALSDEDGSSGSALSTVVGNARRTFVAPVQLDDVDESGALLQAQALLVTAGRFQVSDRVDALALGYHVDPTKTPPVTAPELWLLPNLQEPVSTTARLGWGLDERLVPAVTDPLDEEEGQVLASLAAGDLDGDGLDEAILAAPVEQHTRCLIVTAGFGGGAREVTPRASVVLAEPCVNSPVVHAADLDADGAKDLLIALGGDGLDGPVVALWNDGRGGFDAGTMTTVVSSAERPRGFTEYQSPSGQLRLAIVEEKAVRVLEPRGRARSFSDGGLIAELDAGTGIAAGDVSGDGLADLVVADAGNLRLFTAAVVKQ